MFFFLFLTEKLPLQTALKINFMHTHTHTGRVVSFTNIYFVVYKKKKKTREIIHINNNNCKKGF